jgi:uncharacterized protein YeaO (DUF488 family)
MEWDQRLVIFSRCSGYRAPWIGILAAAFSISVAVEADPSGAAQTALHRAARTLGTRLGAEIAGRVAPDAGPHDVLAATLEVLSSRGYEPYDDPAGVVGLRNCPFDRLAAQHGELVCGASLAMIGGLAGRVRAGLDPRPGLCCAARTAGDPPAASEEGRGLRRHARPSREVTMTGKARPTVGVKRVYEAPDPGDGTRVLVDRIWPRGLSKERAAVDLWLKAVAPSGDLRRWYRHDPDRFGEFARRYRAELAHPERSEAVDQLRELVSAGPVTLLTASREVARSQAAVLAEVLGAR